MLGRVLGALAAVCAIGYPILVYVGLTTLRARSVAFLMIGLVLIVLPFKFRDAIKRKRVGSAILVPLIVLLMSFISAIINNATLILFAPVVISSALLVTFGMSLRPKKTPMIETFARLQEPELSPDEVAWCRSTTWVWCGFFVVNGVIALCLALWAPVSWWALYAGGIAYLLIGALGAGEYLARKRRFQKFGPGLIDRILFRFLARDCHS